LDTIAIFLSIVSGKYSSVLSMPIIVLFCATIFNETIKKKLILINTIIDFEI